jgi:hypothetical protein
MEWPQLWPDWVTPELVLRNWRERIEHVAAEEGAHLASLPYVLAVAVTGSVARGNTWPCLERCSRPEPRGPSTPWQLA